MNTEQSNVGKGDSANPIEQTANLTTSVANSQAETLSTVANRQPNSLRENLYESLYQLINDFMNQAGSSGPIELVNELMLNYLHEAIGLDESGEPSKSISGTNLVRILNVTQLTEFLGRLGEIWLHIRRVEATVE